MVTEDFVSFEVAKLLKEKGFDEATCGYYHDDYNGVLLVSSPTKHNGSINSVSAPTQGHTMKWLREVHNYLILIDVDDMLEGYQWAIYYTDSHEITPYAGLVEGTYEEACEAAIKYCLENLI